MLSAAALVAAAAAFAGGASAAALALCTTTTSAPTATPSTAQAGTPITYTATVAASSGCANGSPTGTVSFYSNYILNGRPASFQVGAAVTLQPSGTPGQSTATLVVNSLPAGSFAISASYTSNDESLFYDSSGPGTSVVIQSTNLHTPLIAFTESSSTINVGQSVTFHVHITPVDASGDPTGAVATGSVDFSAGPTPAPSAQFRFWSQNLDSTGSLTFSYNGFVPGDYVVIASYGGDNQDSPVFGQLPLTVLPAATPIATTTTVTASPASFPAGSSTTLTAHVVETATGTPLPAGGTVDFFAGPSPTNVFREGTGTLDANGDAQISVGNFTPATYTVRAQYVGTTTIAGSSSDGTIQVTGTVGAGTNPTVVGYTGAVEANYGTQATLSGRLAFGSGAGLAGRTLTLTMGSQTCTAAPTDSEGSASCTIAVSQDAGAYPVSAHFAGDANFAAADSAASAFTVDPAPTQLSYTGATGGASGAQATLSAHLTANGSDLAGKVVTIAVNGQSCNGTTNSSGAASCTVTLNEAPGAYGATAHFAGDTDYLPSDAAAATFTVAPTATTTAYTGATQGTEGAHATLSAHVTGAPDGGTVTFTVGAESCIGTLSGGDAACTVTLTDAPGASYTVNASYAGDTSHQGSSDSKAFTIIAATSTTKATPVAPVLAGKSATLTATVAPATATGTVTFSSSGTPLCAGTLSAGAASCVATFAQPGSYSVTARYGGDGVYPPSSGATTVLVYALAPGGGSFVVGDKSASGSVTFWGAQWSKTNVLGAGAAPDAFKGFAVNRAACGGTWSTDPGNSAPPPAGPLPSYMAVLVTSASAKAGSTIYGNTVAIVIVQTNAGYRNDPGHAGTGTVVATLCTGSAALTKPATKTTYTGATSGTTGSPATLSATLTDASGNPLNGETVTLALGTQSCSDKTDGKGNASCTVTVTQGAGTYPVTATFAGDAGYSGSSASATLTVGAPTIDCKKSKCESLLADPSASGRTLSLVYMDDSAIKSATVVANGQSLSVTIAPTSGQPSNYVDANGGSRSNKSQSLISFTLPAAGTYTIVVTAYDGDGDLDQYSWTITTA